jgi:hypothetical protein
MGKMTLPEISESIGKSNRIHCYKTLICATVYRILPEKNGDRARIIG